LHTHDTYLTLDGVVPDMTVAGEFGVFECDICGNIGLGSGGIVCCDRPMEPSSRRDDAGEAEDPSLDDLLRTVFGMSSTELEICLCVMEGGDVTVRELAEQVGYDRSVVTRHLNHLVEMGVVERRRQLLERGGHVYAYTPVEPETVRQRLGWGFIDWTRTAAGLIDELSREKVEAIVESGAEDVQWTVFREE
jgi:predicted transcriptional regulator